MKYRLLKILPFYCALILTGSVCKAQMIEGEDIPEFGKTFGVVPHKHDYKVAAVYMQTNTPGNIMWPGDSMIVNIQLVNNTAQTITVKGNLETIVYGTKGNAGDVWIPAMFKIKDESTTPFTAVIKAGGFININIKPSIPDRFGAYGFVADLGESGRQFITSCVRTFAVKKEKIQYPSFCLDDISNDVLQRLGTHAIRREISYKPTNAPDFEKWYSKVRKQMQACQKSDIAVLVKMGAPEPFDSYQPMNVSRPWLDDKSVLQTAKTDMAWIPEYDNDFKKLVYKLAVEFGWPKGPVNAFALWNEPWDGVSISGWGADIPRYREIYIKMAEAVEDARRDAGVDILIGGTSSTSNALDKLFADGTDTMLKRFDFCSIHYQGMQSSATIKKWVDRKDSLHGRVKIWDTESWVANTDDRVAAVVATNRSTGYDRAMGVYRGNICHTIPQIIKLANGSSKEIEVVHAWSVAASIGATQHFIGERKFAGLLFKNGLPWVTQFEGLPNEKNSVNKEDGTLVVVGDIGEEFGAENVLFRTARGLKEQEHEAALKQQIALLDTATQQTEINQLKMAIAKNEVLDGATLSFDDGKGKFRLFDFYGNKVSSNNGKIIIPLNSNGYFLRTDGSAGSFDTLVKAVQQADIQGIEPLETIAYDFLQPLDKGASLRLKLTNVLNRPITGVLKLKVAGVVLKDSLVQINFNANETKLIEVAASALSNAPDNCYLLNLIFDASKDGMAKHEEILHANVISKRKITVDGKLDDWANVLPQRIISDGAKQSSITEEAWFPFKNFDKSTAAGLSNGYLAYDENYFYFAAKVADSSIDEGMIRFENRDNDEFFYPEKSYVPYNKFRFGGAMLQDGISYSVRWEGKIKIRYNEEYLFSLNTKNITRLWINNTLVIDNWYNTLKPTSTGKIFMSANKTYDIKIELSKEWDAVDMQLSWQSKHQPKQIIPAQFLSHQKNTLPNKGLTAQFFNGPAFNAFNFFRIDSSIHLQAEKDEVPDSEFLKKPLAALTWPKNVRRYSYRKDPELPSGNFANHDNIQIAFNVLEEEQKDLYPYPPGTMKGYTNYQCTDYEYALNPVAAKYGGGTEIWRLRAPGLPHKHFFPRQGASPLDGAVKNGTLVITRTGNTRIIEAAIPWSETPEVKKKMDAHQTIKFSYRVNDNSSNDCMELSKERSVSKINGSFMVDWKLHWANELEFSFEQ
jgi:hypothetical protein